MGIQNWLKTTCDRCGVMHAQEGLWEGDVEFRIPVQWSAMKVYNPKDSLYLLCPVCSESLTLWLKAEK